MLSTFLQSGRSRASRRDVAAIAYGELRPWESNPTDFDRPCNVVQKMSIVINIAQQTLANRR